MPWTRYPFLPASHTASGLNVERHVAIEDVVVVLEGVIFGHKPSFAVVSLKLAAKIGRVQALFLLGRKDTNPA